MTTLLRLFGNRRNLTIGGTLFVIAIWSLLWPGTAHGHTDFVGSQPADGASLDDPISHVELEFTDALDPAGTTARVLDGDGRPVEIQITPISDTVVRIDATDGFEMGRFVVLWSVRSVTDGHELSGSMSFEVGLPPTEPDEEPDDVEVVEEPTDQTAPPTTIAIEDPLGTAPPVLCPIPVAGAASSDFLLTEEGNGRWDVMQWLGRWISFSGALLAIGAFAFAASALTGTTREIHRAMSLIRFGGSLILLGSLIDLTAVGLDAGESFMTAILPWSWIDDIPTTTGYAMVLRLVGAVALLQSPYFVVTSLAGTGPGTADDPHTDRHGLTEPGSVQVLTRSATDRLVWPEEWVLMAGLVLVATSFALDGHTADTGIIGQISTVTHVFAAGVWAGGLVALAGLLIARHRAGDPVDAADVGFRFSRIATVAVVVAGSAGIALAWLLTDSVSDLWSGSWGRALMVKTSLVVVAASIGAYNHFRVVPRLSQPDDSAASMLRRTVTIESALVIAVVAVTAVLVVSAR